MELFCSYKDQAEGLHPFTLMPWMHEVGDPENGLITPRVQMLKAREIASSTFWVFEKLRKMLTRPGADMMTPANNEKNATNMVKIARVCVENLPEKLRPRIGKNNETELEFPGLRNHILAIAGNPSAARSERAFYVVGTEAAHWLKPDDYLATVEACLIKGGEMVLESTANSQADVFADIWNDPAKDIDSNPQGYRKLFYGWWANPSHDTDWLDQKRVSSTNAFVFNREHPSTPDEAFTGASDTYFDAETLASGQACIREPLESRDIGRAGSDPGWIWVWKRPIPGRDYVLGVDIAEGRKNLRGNPDWSDARMMDVRTKEVVAVIHCRLPVDEYADQCVKLANEYAEAEINFERNGHTGGAMLMALRALDYKYLTRTQKFTVDVFALPSKDTDELGWLTTAKSKQIALSDLYIAMKNGDFTCYDRTFWEAARNLGRDLRGIGQAHDDPVMASAIAYQAAKNYVPRAKKPHPWEEEVLAKPSWQGGMPWHRGR